jgi:RHS repeat-associated protein
VDEILASEDSASGTTGTVLWGLGDHEGTIRDVLGNDVADHDATAHWMFNETGGTTTADDSGHGYSGVLLGNASVAGGVLTLDGSGDAARVPVQNGSSLDIFGNNAELTISAWVCPDNVTNLQYIAGKLRLSSFVQYGVYVNANVLYFVSVGGDSATSQAGVLTVGKWQHVVVTYKAVGAGNGEVRFYVDGVNVTGTDHTCVPIQHADCDFYIGARGNSSSDPHTNTLAYSWDGQIADVRMYSRAVPAAEVPDLLKYGVVDHRKFDAFGKITSETAPATDFIFGYTGQALDKVTGLLDYGHRWYDASVGRFANEDPSGFDAGDMNLYRYVNNDPLNNTDPSGRCSQSVAKYTGVSYDVFGNKSNYYAGMSAGYVNPAPTNTWQNTVSYTQLAQMPVSAQPNKFVNDVNSYKTVTNPGLGNPVLTNGKYAYDSFGNALAPNPSTGGWTNPNKLNINEPSTGLMTTQALGAISGVGAFSTLGTVGKTIVSSALGGAAVTSAYNTNQYVNATVQAYELGDIKSATMNFGNAIGSAGNGAMFGIAATAALPSTSRVGVTPQGGQFKNGNIFMTTVKTSQGDVYVLAETVVEGKTLHLKDIVIEPVGGQTLNIGTNEVLAGRQQLIEQARAAGFEKLQITGERVTGANVGKQVNKTINLKL